MIIRGGGSKNQQKHFGTGFFRCKVTLKQNLKTIAVGPEKPVFVYHNQSTPLPSDTQVKTWYQNRRTKWKRTTSVGLELLAETGNYSALQSLYRGASPYALAGLSSMPPYGGSPTSASTSPSTSNPLFAAAAASSGLSPLELYYRQVQAAAAAAALQKPGAGGPVPPAPSSFGSPHPSSPPPPGLPPPASVLVPGGRPSSPAEQGASPAASPAPAAIIKPTPLPASAAAPPPAPGGAEAAAALTLPRGPSLSPPSPHVPAARPQN